MPPDFGAPELTRLAFPNRFQIIKRLGAGGMAEVFAAHRLEADGSRTPVVIKRPLPELAAHPEFLDMFLDEARIASAIDHPNVVRVHELVREADNCLLVMELVDGKPLSSLMVRSERKRPAAGGAGLGPPGGPRRRGPAPRPRAGRRAGHSRWASSTATSPRRTCWSRSTAR